MKLIQKLSLLCVSLLVVSSGVLLPSLPEITAEYSQIAPVFIELLSTMPALFTMLTISFSPAIADRLGYKRLVEWALIITLISGFLPLWTDSFVWLFLSRVSFGIGVGLFNPLLFSFSTSLYEGRELSSMIGFQSAFEGLGGISISLLVAQLIQGGWRQTLWVYLIILPVWILFRTFVPDIVPERQDKSQKIQKTRIDSGFWGLIALLVFLITIYTSVSFKMTALMIEGAYGTAKESSLALAFMGLGAMVAGFIFGKMIQLLDRWLLALSFSSLSLALYLLAISRSSFLTIIATGLIGLSFRTFVPYLINLANQVKDGSGQRRTGLLLMAFNLGSAFAPLTIRFLQNMLQLQKVASLFILESILVALLACIVVLYQIFLAQKGASDDFKSSF